MILMKITFKTIRYSLIFAATLHLPMLVIWFLDLRFYESFIRLTTFLLGLSSCESLRKLDLTLNFVGEISSVGKTTLNKNIPIIYHLVEFLSVGFAYSQCFP